MKIVDDDFCIGKCIGLSVGEKNIEYALRIFKQKIKNSKLLLTIRDNSYYRKPSEIKRQKENSWKYRNRLNNENIRITKNN